MKKLLSICLFLLCSLAYGQQKDNHEIEGLKIYPNPVTQGKVYIESTEAGDKKIVLYDVFGTPVLERILKNKELPLPNIKPGIYVIRIYTDKNSSTRKLVIK